MVKRKSNKLKELREFTKRAPELKFERYKEVLKETKDPLVRKRLYQMLKATEAKKARETAVQLATPSYRRGLSPGARRLDTKVGGIVRKAIHLAAPRGFIKEITRPTGKGTGRGRGRPKKSYKLRFVPGIGAVRVPTHIYNKMMAEVKAKRRLAQAQKQALIQQQYEAEQLAMTQDPRFQPQDAFLESPDMEHEQEVMRIKQQMELEEQIRQQQVPQRGVVQRTGEVMRRAGAGLSRLGQPRYPQQYPPEMAQYPSQVVPQQVAQQVRGEPRVTTISDRSNILNQPNIFNRPENAAIGFKRRL